MLRGVVMKNEQRSSSDSAFNFSIEMTKKLKSDETYINLKFLSQDHCWFCIIWLLFYNYNFNNITFQSNTLLICKCRFILKNDVKIMIRL